jgi:hypothetical protein
MASEQDQWGDLKLESPHNSLSVEQALFESLTEETQSNDEFVFVNNEMEEAARYIDGHIWYKDANTALMALRSSLGSAGAIPQEKIRDLSVLSTEAAVQREIQRYIDNECLIGDLRPFDAIVKDRTESINSIPLPSIRLREFAEANPEMIKSSRAVLPAPNKIKRSVLGDSVGQAIVSVQVYKTMFHRETKILEVDLLLSDTLLDLFRVITEAQPETKMFDGPAYAGSGMILIGESMYVTGQEDYSAPYRDWATHYDIPHAKFSMEETTLGSLSNLPSLIATTACCFLFFCGNEMRRMYFSSLAIKKPETDYPRVTFRRRVGRVQRCCLCTTRTADLIILNDVMLPKNPSHCCNGCYRRLRSGPTGEFMSPGPDVILSPFFHI